MKLFIIDILVLAQKKYLDNNSKEENSIIKQIMSVIIRKYCDSIPVTFISRAAQLEAKGIDLFNMNWSDQNKFDSKRKVYHLEHKTTVSDLVDLILEGKDVFDVINSMEFGWILKEEDKVLNKKGYKIKRADHDNAYRECGIEIIKSNSLKI